MKQLLQAALFALFASVASCATTGATTADLSPELQSRWNTCEPQIARWCRVQAHGDPAHELECKRDARRGYANASSDELRARYLTDHGCTQQ